MSHRTLSPELDLPRIDSRRTGRPTWYVYAVRAAVTSDAPGAPMSLAAALTKVGTRAGTDAVWQRPNHFPGETVFIPRSRTEGAVEVGDDDEDGVVVVSH